MQSFDQAIAFINAITNNQAETAIIDFRAIHDVDKGIAGIPFRDTIFNAWSSIVHYNNQGYGIFAVIAELDGNGRELANVHSIRAHYIDLDNLSAAQNLERAMQWYPAPSFAVNSSPNKYHVYWSSTPYRDNDRFSLIQRKMRQLFDGDKSIIDATRVMRLPGTYHLKNPSNPHLVNCFTLPGYGFVTPPEALEAALQHVNVIDSFGVRKPLGDPELAAPSLQNLMEQMRFIDPNALDRGEWISCTAAFKQSGWSLATEETLYEIYSQWCARYAQNDLAENQKQWNSIRDSEVGWPALRRRAPQAVLGASGNIPAQLPGAAAVVPPSASPAAVMPMPAPAEPSTDSEMLTAQEQAIYFKNCILIERIGEILGPNGRMMNATKFNASFGGKKFIIDSTGKLTNEPWQAATRSTLWTVPKVDHTRFLPKEPYGSQIVDSLGRVGVNLYKPAIIATRDGDVSPFLRHLSLILPDPKDQKILLDFFAHNAQYPGDKIYWAPVIQSVEGVGKGVLKMVVEHVIGDNYVYFPNAKEMVESGSKFNAWLRNKLFILADEIKVDEKRDMIEVLKPMISEERIEIQAKGQDQDKDDNPTNWMFFTNYKDAIPVNQNARRFAIFYSPIQSKHDLLERQMGDAYFDGLYNWLRNGGKEIVANFLLNYPIERGAIPKRAPDTSSTFEALRQSRGPVEQLIMNAIEDGLPGFRGGWVSVMAVLKLAKLQGLRVPSPKTVETILEAMQYFDCGRSVRPHLQEDTAHKSHLYNVARNADISQYGRWQGYE